MTPQEFHRFRADEQPAIDQLKHFVGRGLAPHLDGSVQSLAVLDQFISNLTKDPGWMASPLFRDISEDIRRWLAVRLAYYLAAYLRRVYAVDWRISDDDESPVYDTPVLSINNIEVSPLEIANAYLVGGVKGGLYGLVSDLEREAHPARH
jgi:hypothetical protein